MSDKQYNLYFDNAATSWPKPEAVYRAAENYLRAVGGSPGRSSHRRSMEAGRLVLETRERLANFIGAGEPERVAFAFNATDALNMAIKGVLKEGDHVIYTSLEHNSVLRPLGSLKRAGRITTTEIPVNREGLPDLDYLENSFTANTRMVICNHASNITGTILPVEEIAQIAHNKGALVLVDAAQTAGALPLDVNKMEVDLLALTGHKSLLGMPGTGALYVAEEIDIKPWREGGTGSHSEKDEHPWDMPERLEAGTMNSPGLAALNEGLKFIEQVGLKNIRHHEIKLAHRLQEGFEKIPGIKLYGPSSAEKKTAVISFTIEGVDSGELGFALEEGFGILSRTGLHCAPQAHSALGTFPQGSIRLSPGYFHTEEDLDYLLDCLKEIVSLISN